ncbi:hypothetical protein V1506DRAFT_549122 [Lipomyces tetrasporus]
MLPDKERYFVPLALLLPSYALSFDSSQIAITYYRIACLDLTRVVSAIFRFSVEINSAKPVLIAMTLPNKDWKPACS